MPDPTSGTPTRHEGQQRQTRLRVLITRPLEQATSLVDGCRELGLESVLLPTIAIEAVAPPDGAWFPEQGLAVFTSANAVRYAHRHAPLPWPSVATLAIGRATAAALSTAGHAPVIPPEPPFTSEALLTQLQRTPPAALADGMTVITGEDGRGWLMDRLRAHGHRVTVIELYRRVVPTYDADALDALLDRTPDVITCSSDSALNNLVLIAAHRADSLRQCPLIVNSERNARNARENGFQGPIRVALEAGDHGQLEQLRLMSSMVGF